MGWYGGHDNFPKYMEERATNDVPPEREDADTDEALELADNPVSRWTPEGSLRTHPCGACGARSLARCLFPLTCPIERT